MKKLPSILFAILFPVWSAIANQQSDIYFLQGIQLDKQERYNEAIQAYIKAIEIDPSDDRVWSNLAANLADETNSPDTVNLAAAQQSAISAIDRNRNQYQAWNTLGIIFSLLKQENQAIQCYQQALKIKPDYPKCLFNLGVFYNSLGQDNAAIDAYLRLLKLDPDDWQAWNNLAISYKNIGDIERYRRAKASAEYLRKKAEQGAGHTTTCPRYERYSSHILLTPAVRRFG